MLTALFAVACAPLPSQIPGEPSILASPAWPPDYNAISSAFTTPILDVRTDGREIVWSRGARDTDPTAAPDLWGFAPGDREPREIFHNPNRDSVLALVAVHNGHYALVETNFRVYGENAYRLWLIAGQSPKLIDESDWRPGERSIPIPFVALSDDQLIWSAVHHTESGLRFQLLSYGLASQQTTVLQAADADKTAYWFPSLDSAGKRLVYATVEEAGEQDEFHVYLLNLDPSGGQPARLDRDGLATMPVIDGDTIVWKAVRGNVFNASSLVRYSVSRASEAPSPLSPLGARVNYPSIGTRFAVAWQDEDSDVGLLDLETGERLSIDPVPSSNQEGRERAVIAGDLLLYLRADLRDTDGLPLELVWVDLAPS